MDHPLDAIDSILQTPPERLALVVLGAVTALLAGHALLVLALSLLARRHPTRALLALVETLSTRSTRALAARVLGGTLAAAALGPTVPGVAWAGPPPPTMSAHAVGSTPAPTTVVMRVAGEDPAPEPAPVVMRAAPADPPTPSTTTAPPGAEGASPTPPPVRMRAASPSAPPPSHDVDPGPQGRAEGGAEGDRPASGPPTGSWTIRPGDHLWHVARTTLGTARGRPVSDLEVERYWRAVIACNAERFVVPGNPDLVLPGQVMVLPPVG